MGKKFSMVIEVEDITEDSVLMFKIAGGTAILPNGDQFLFGSTTNCGMDFSFRRKGTGGNDRGQSFYISPEAMIEALYEHIMSEDGV